MKKKLLIAVFAAVMLPAGYCSAQSAVANIPSPETVDVNGLRPQDGYMLPWKTIMEADIAWKKRVWRNVDMKDAQNAPFVYNAAIGKENNLAHFIAQGAIDGKYKAYSAVNDRFTTELTAQELTALGKFNAEKVAGFRVKEDWLYLEKEHRMVVRILGIAPLIEVKDEKGVASLQPAFWVYYPESRTYFASHEVYNGGARVGMNWDQLFERGNFKGHSDKISDTKKN